MKLSRILCSVVITLCFFAVVALATVPNQLNFQGTLSDSNGSPITGTRIMQFFLYEDSIGGPALWGELHPAVDVQDGMFRVILGSDVPLPPPIFAGGVLWLGIQVDPDPTELTPRQPLVSVPYGIRANPDDDWGISGSNIYRLDGYVGIGTSTPSSGYLAPLLHLQHYDHGGIVIESTESPSWKWQIGTGGNNTGSLDFANLYGGNNLYMTIETDGDVGIGVTWPNHKLDVDGDVNTSSEYKIDGTTVLSIDGTECILVGNGAGVNNTGLWTTMVGDSAGVDNEGGYNTFLGCQSGRFNSTGFGNAFVGAGAGMSNTTGIYGTFVGTGAGSSNGDGCYNTYIGNSAGLYNSGGWNVFLGASTGHHNHFGSHNVFLGYNAGFYESGSDKLYIANSADTSGVLIYGEFDNRTVGIGTMDPTHSLTVGHTTDDVLRLIGPDGFFGHGARLNFGDGDHVYLDEDEDDKLTIYASRTAINGGNVGIGTTIPGRLLHLYGAANPRLLIESPSNQAPELNLQRGTITHAIYINGGNDLVFYRGGDRVTFTDGGDVGIGTTIPGYKLDVEGDIQCTNLHETSDDRLKTNISTLSGALDKVNRLRGVSFEWNEEAEDVGATAGEKQIGVLASEVEQVFPELVSTPENGYKSMDYTKLTAVLVEAVKELHAQNQMLIQRIEMLESSNQ